MQNWERAASQKFSHWLRVLDIDANDLESMFEMLDRDGNGDITMTQMLPGVATCGAEGGVGEPLGGPPRAGSR